MPELHEVPQMQADYHHDLEVENERLRAIIKNLGVPHACGGRIRPGRGSCTRCGAEEDAAELRFPTAPPNEDLNMECVILVRLNSGEVRAIKGDEDEIVVFPNLDEAATLAETHWLCQEMPYQVVELEEL